MLLCLRGIRTPSNVDNNTEIDLCVIVADSNIEWIPERFIPCYFAIINIYGYIFIYSLFRYFLYLYPFIRWYWEKNYRLHKTKGWQSSCKLIVGPFLGVTSNISCYAQTCLLPCVWGLKFSTLKRDFSEIFKTLLHNFSQVLRAVRLQAMHSKCLSFVSPVINNVKLVAQSCSMFPESVSSSMWLPNSVP